MIKKGQLKIVVIIVLSVVLHLSSQSQNRKYFIITGKILCESQWIDHCAVQIIKTNKSAVSSSIPNHGRFRLELEYNTEYQLIFNRKGYLPKTIVVNTEIPQEEMSNPENFPHFLMGVKLFKDSQDTENLSSGLPLQQISYSSQQKCFARVPTMLDIQYVEKGNSTQHQDTQAITNKSKMQVYQIF